MKNISLLIIFVLAGICILSAQTVQYGVDVNNNTGKVTMYAKADGAPLGANNQLTTALFTFTLPKGTSTVPGGGSFTNLAGNWAIDKFTSDNLPMGVTDMLFDTADLYAVSFTGPVGFMPAFGDALPDSVGLFCFVITDGCNGGGTINILNDAEAVALEASFNNMHAFANQFSLMMPAPGGGPKCVMDVYDGNVGGADMPECPPPLVPTMSQWALFLFGLGVFTLGIVVVYNISRAKQMA